MAGDDGGVRVVPMGVLVDGLMSRPPTDGDGSTEWCALPDGHRLEVPSLTAEGKVIWKPVQSASRHLHRNPLLRIRTRLGRTITATANHSFVTRRNGHIEPILGSELRLGDRVPVLRRWSVPSHAQELDLEEFLPKNPYWHGTQLAKTRGLGARGRRGYGRDIVVPVGA